MNYIDLLTLCVKFGIPVGTYVYCTNSYLTLANDIGLEHPPPLHGHPDWEFEMEDYLSDKDDST